ncbi:MAG: hypothetical protein KGZ40_05390 [Clostridiales bacterium]|nr:hypothetical protein [Clostridiales bacterium]
MTEAILPHLSALAISVPLAGAPIAFLAGFRWGKPIALVTSLLFVVAASALALSVAERGESVYQIGGWEAPLGISLVADGLSATFVLITSVVGLGITVYALAYFTDADRYRFFWSLWLFLLASMAALFLSGDVFNLYVCLELVTVSAVALVSLSGRRETLIAAMRYLLAAILGSLFYLLGVGLLYGAFGVLDMRSLADVIEVSVTGQAAFALITVGMMMKTALFPLHFWLPPAHANAPSPVSAALSALVIKGSFYILLRLWTEVADPSYIPGAGLMLGVLGAVAIVWGSLQALRQVRLKMLVAYSTVAQVGYLFILFPIVTAGGGYAADAWSAGVFHVVSHALAKGGMFLAAGAVLVRLGHDRLDGLAGLARRSPLAVMAFGFAGVTMMGLPPSGGFVVKWLYITAAIESGAWWWAAVVLTGGLLAALYMARVIGPAFGRADAPGGDIVVDAGRTASLRTMELVALALAVGALALGIVAQPLLDLMAVGAPFAGPGMTP